MVGGTNTTMSARAETKDNTLLTIPPEVRFKIFHHVLAGIRVRYKHTQRRCIHMATPEYKCSCLPDPKTASNRLAILLVSHQVREEAITCFTCVETAIFDFVARPLNREPMPRYLPKIRFLETSMQFPTRGVLAIFPSLQHLIIEDHAWYGRRQYGYFEIDDARKRAEALMLARYDMARHTERLLRARHRRVIIQWRITRYFAMEPTISRKRDKVAVSRGKASNFVT